MMPQQPTGFTMSAEEIVGEQDTSGRKNGPRLLPLWAVVSGLWTVATLLRIDHEWAPIAGWRRVLEGPWIWISLVVPPLMFAVIFAAIRRIKMARK